MKAEKREQLELRAGFDDKCCLCGNESRIMLSVGKDILCKNCVTKVMGKALNKLKKR